MFRSQKPQKLRPQNDLSTTNAKKCKNTAKIHTKRRILTKKSLKTIASRKNSTTSITDSLNAMNKITENAQNVQNIENNFKNFCRNDNQKKIFEKKKNKNKIFFSSSKDGDNDERYVETIQATRLDIDRTALDSLFLQKMIFIQSYEIYGGSQGLYDYGPTGSAVMSNIRSQWRKQFIKAERMLEFSGSTLTPESVLKSSGHLDRFTDWMTSTKEPVISPLLQDINGIGGVNGGDENSQKNEKNNQKKNEKLKKEKGKDKGKEEKKSFESEHIRTDKIVEDYLDDKIESLTKLKAKGGVRSQKGGIKSLQSIQGQTQTQKEDGNDDNFVGGISTKEKEGENDENFGISFEEDELLSKMIQDRALVGGLSGPELDALVVKYGITHNGYQLNPSNPFNLMFATQFGPSGKQPFYFRPETAQGIFVNFQRLFSQNNNQLPFSVAQIGTAYRNEISPRNGILRTREFTQAEIEHFVDPVNKDHPKFHEISKKRATFLSANQQISIANNTPYQTTIPGTPYLSENGEILSFEEAVYGINDPNETKTNNNNKKKIGKVVDNESLGYFLSKTLNFLKSIGVHENKIRFRQHLPSEMAHYATDCWDAEILTSFGWVECVGHADRSAHDLTVHAQATKTDLIASKVLDPPEINKYMKIGGNKGKIVPFLKKNGYNSDEMSKIMQFINTTDQNALLQLRKLMIDTAKNQGIVPPPFSGSGSSKSSLSASLSSKSAIGGEIGEDDRDDDADWANYDFTANPIEITTPLFGIEMDETTESQGEISKMAKNHDEIAKTAKNQDENMHNSQKSQNIQNHSSLSSSLSPKQLTLTITTDLLDLSLYEERVHVKQFTPHVIEPSFGLARIFYSVLEHSFDQRPEDEQRKILKFPAEIAPYQVAIYPVTSNLGSSSSGSSSGASGNDSNGHGSSNSNTTTTINGKSLIRRLEKEAIDLDMAVQIDESKSSIGKKYSKWDENGVPFAITLDALSVIGSGGNEGDGSRDVDDGSDQMDRNSDDDDGGNLEKDDDDNKNNSNTRQNSNSMKTTHSPPIRPTVTIRERDSCEQVRIDIDQAMGVVHGLVKGRMTWEGVTHRFGKVKNNLHGGDESVEKM